MFLTRAFFVLSFSARASKQSHCTAAVFLLLLVRIIIIIIVIIILTNENKKAETNDSRHVPSTTFIYLAPHIAASFSATDAVPITRRRRRGRLIDYVREKRYFIVSPTTSAPLRYSLAYLSLVERKKKSICPPVCQSKSNDDDLNLMFIVRVHHISYGNGTEKDIFRVLLSVVFVRHDEISGPFRRNRNGRVA